MLTKDQEILDAITTLGSNLTVKIDALEQRMNKLDETINRLDEKIDFNTKAVIDYIGEIHEKLEKQIYITRDELREEFKKELYDIRYENV